MPTPLVASDERLSAQQVADRFGIAEKTVRRWIDRGRLQADRRGHAFAIKLEDAEQAFRSSRSSRSARQHSELETELRRLETAHAALQGRYEEVKERSERLEEALALERRHSAKLEIEAAREAA